MGEAVAATAVRVLVASGGVAVAVGVALASI
jgi:hypothetical protein